MQEEAKAAVDVIAVTTTVSTLMGWLPAVAAALMLLLALTGRFHFPCLRVALARQGEV